MKPIKIKNGKLAILAFIFFCLFMGLGCWQLSRANQKKILLDSFAQRTARPPLTAQDLNQLSDRRFYQVQLQGMFDNEHTLLLDNKTFHGKVGYEVYTPFKAHGMRTPILVDRGFIPMGHTRKILPVISPIKARVTIIGMLNLPPAYVAWGQIQESAQATWPLRIEFINLTELSSLIGYALDPHVLSIAPNDAAAYLVEWKVLTMGPEKHRGYAVQWFALALTLLILSVALNYEW